MKKYEKRLTIPEATNPYYILKQHGGYALGIAGSKGGKSVLPNCAGYAACRYNEYNATGKMQYFAYWSDAENFYDVAVKDGLPVGSTPKVGAILCWKKGKTWYNPDGAGHVAFVEEVKSDGSIITSESAWGGTEFYTMHRYRENGNWGMNNSYQFVGFIYPPDTKCVKVLKFGDNCPEVVDLQSKLNVCGYYCGAVDGIFGRKTLAQVLLFQYEKKLDIDGIVGEKTWGVLNAGK